MLFFIIKVANSCSTTADYLTRALAVHSRPAHTWTCHDFCEKAKRRECRSSPRLTWTLQTRSTDTCELCNEEMTRTNGWALPLLRTRTSLRPRANGRRARPARVHRGTWLGAWSMWARRWKWNTLLLCQMKGERRNPDSPNLSNHLQIAPDAQALTLYSTDTTYKGFYAKRKA